MKKIFIAFVIGILIFLSVGDAKIRIGGEFKDSYLLGEEIYGSIEITGEFDGNALLKVYLECGEKDFTFYAMPLVIKTGIIKNIELPAFPVYKDLLGKCKVVGTVDSFEGGLIEEDESASFEISDILELNFSIREKEIKQGGLLEFEISSAEKKNYGLVAVFEKDSTKQEVMRNFSGDSFEWIFSLPKEISRGKGALSISVNDELGNKANKVFDIGILPVIANINLSVIGNNLKPKERVVVFGDLTDYAGERVEDNMSISLKDSKGRIIENFWIASSGAKEIYLLDYSPPGEYTFYGLKGELNDEKKFNVIELRDIAVGVDEGFLVLTNKGNVVYEGKTVLNASLGKKIYIVPLEVYVEPGEKQRFDLKKNLPEDEYDLFLDLGNISYELKETYISDSRPLTKKISQGFGGLTGNAVINTEDETNLFWAIIGLIFFIALVFIIARSRLKNRLFSQIWSLAERHKKEVGGLYESLNREKNATREMKKMFARYVDADVLREVGRKGMEKREVSVLFTDIRGFSAMFEQGNEKDIISMLDMHFKRISEIIKRNGGFINKFIGDSVMALFNAVREDKEHVFKAAKCAIEIHEEMNKLNERLERKGFPRIKVGVGVDSGMTNVGNLGSLEKMEYTAIGVPVNIAARLQEKAIEGESLLSERVYMAVKDRITGENFGERKLKNINNPIRVFNALRVK